MRKQTTAIACLLLLLAATPALAEPVGECFHFYYTENLIQTEYVTIDCISVTRLLDEYIILNVFYNLPDELDDETLFAVEKTQFCLVADAASTDLLIPVTVRADYAFSEHGGKEWKGPNKETEPSISLKPGAALQQESQWEGLRALPSTLYVRPYYVNTDTWGEVIALHLHQGERVEVHSHEDVSPPLTNKEARKESNG